MRRIALIAAVISFTWSPPAAFAQKGLPQATAPQQTLPRPVVKLETVEIGVGQKIADADAALRHHGMQASIGQAFQTSGGPQDSQDLSFSLEKRTFVAVHFHKTTQQVYAITACIMPEGNPGRINHTYFSVRKITLHPDGSYSLQFEPGK